MDEVTNPEPRQMKDESPKAFRKRYARWKGLGVRKKGSAKAQNKGRDTATCLVCGHIRLNCICAGHMSENAIKAFHEEQKKRSTPEQSGF